MDQRNDSTGQRQSQSQQSQVSQSQGTQSQGQSQSPRRSDGPFVDEPGRAGGGLHPGSDRDDYGSPHGHQSTVASDPSGQVGVEGQPWREMVGGHEQERREPGQVERGDRGTDTGAPAGYGDRGHGGTAPSQSEQELRGRRQPEGVNAGEDWPGFDEQQGRVEPDSPHARQAEQGESYSGSGHPRGDYGSD